MRATDIWFVIALSGWLLWLGAVAFALGLTSFSPEDTIGPLRQIPFLCFIVLMIHLVFRNGAFMKAPFHTFGWLVAAPLGAWVYLYVRDRKTLFKKV